MLCYDLYKETKMAALYIYSNSFLAFSWGRNSYLGCDAFDCIIVQFTLHIFTI